MRAPWAWFRGWKKRPPPGPSEEELRAIAEANERAVLRTLTGVEPGEMALYRQALRHRSALRGQKDSHRHSNERLEFLGDAVLGFVVGAHLYRVFTDADEGFLSRLRSKLVSGTALAGYARSIGLGPHLTMSPEMRLSGGEDHATLLADSFEALIGALYLDQGMEAARDFIHRSMLDVRDLATLAAERDNYKSALLEKAQSEGWPQPVYRIVSAEGASHARVFTVEVDLRGEPYGSGQATSKKQAEQLAAQAALVRLAEMEDEVVGRIQGQGQ